MNIDDPTTGEFLSWQSYHRFANKVRYNRRYLWDSSVHAFLETVRGTIRDRDVELLEGRIFYRAQLGIDWFEHKDDEGNYVGEEPLGYSAERMKTRPNQATEGRANPAGIPVLYLGTTVETAVSEVRPWVGSQISVAQFKILRTLKVLDLSRGHGKSSYEECGMKDIFGTRQFDASEKEKAVWIDIDSAFSRPISLSDDTADYVPTQILAELFRNEGYDAIVYKSQFGETGYNIAIFDPKDADIINCGPYKVTSLKVEFEVAGNHWFSSKHQKS